MSLRVLAAAAVLAFAAPAVAVAQQAPAAPPAAPAADASADAEAAFEAKAEAFGERIEEMRREMQAAVTAAGGDQAKADADLDAIEAKYQPEADAFAAELIAFINSQMEVMPEEQRAQAAAMGPMIEAQIKGATAQVRGEVLQAAAAPPVAAPAQ